ncbi:hypothetical protein MNBD_GAMMA13-1407, partial [hydrothermal vent metagenome]
MKRSGICVRTSALCVPGMGMILWGESPLYIIRRDVITTFQKVLADGKGDESDLTPERSLSANLRADVQKLYQAEPQGESAQHDEAHLDH